MDTTHYGNSFVTIPTFALVRGLLRNDLHSLAPRSSLTSMNRRYEIRDTLNPKDRGQRFTDEARARKELAMAVPAGRFILIDRLTKEEVK